MRVIVGLGNPEPAYVWTRHNLGFLVVDEVGRRCGVTLSRRRWHALTGEGEGGGVPLLLVKPLTHVNGSGRAVAAVLEATDTVPHDVLVVCDDLNLPLGVLRIRSRGRDGGHHGLASVAAALGTGGYPRLRIGIGPAVGGDAVGYVLAPLSGREREALGPVIADAAAACVCWAQDGIVACMQQWNASR